MDDLYFFWHEYRFHKGYFDFSCQLTFCVHFLSQIQQDIRGWLNFISRVLLNFVWFQDLSYVHFFVWETTPIWNMQNYSFCILILRQSERRWDHELNKCSIVARFKFSQNSWLSVFMCLHPLQLSFPAHACIVMLSLAVDFVSIVVLHTLSFHILFTVCQSMHILNSIIVPCLSLWHVVDWMILCPFDLKRHEVTFVI